MDQKEQYLNISRNSYKQKKINNTATIWQQYADKLIIDVVTKTETTVVAKWIDISILFKMIK